MKDLNGTNARLWSDCVHKEATLRHHWIDTHRAMMAASENETQKRIQARTQQRAACRRLHSPIAPRTVEFGPSLTSTETTRLPKLKANQTSPLSLQEAVFGSAPPANTRVVTLQALSPTSPTSQRFVTASKPTFASEQIQAVLKSPQQPDLPSRTEYLTSRKRISLSDRYPLAPTSSQQMSLMVHEQTLPAGPRFGRKKIVATQFYRPNGITH
eukprot:TRINITY_DN8435_c0_g1_i3.p1 TRINITY_DN8435_c0_g1~~TRINITY_DN8435_c0_g1_i3.p1  ORF type:complete len:213 (+),score=31.78 TRINITY_DN8435_c0_g1_i3:154-792(+)